MKLKPMRTLNGFDISERIGREPGVKRFVVFDVDGRQAFESNALGAVLDWASSQPERGPKLTLEVLQMAFKEVENLKAVVADKLAHYVVEVHGRLWQFRFDKAGLVALEAKRKAKEWRYPTYSMLLSQRTRGQLEAIVGNPKHSDESTLGRMESFHVFCPDEWERVTYWFDLFQLANPHLFKKEEGK